MLLREYKPGQQRKILAESDNTDGVAAMWNNNVTSPLIVVSMINGNYNTKDGILYNLVGTPEEMEKVANDILMAARVYRQHA